MFIVQRFTFYIKKSISVTTKKAKRQHIFINYVPILTEIRYRVNIGIMTSSQSKCDSFSGDSTTSGRALVSIRCSHVC